MDEASSGTPSDDVDADVEADAAGPAEQAPAEDASEGPAAPAEGASWEEGLASVGTETPAVAGDSSWDDLPVALGEEVEDPQPPEPSDQEADAEAELVDDDDSDDDSDGDGDGDGDGDDADDLGELDDDDRIAGRRNALPRRVESWRSRSASGAIATALAMGLQQVFEPEKRRPAAVAEAPSNPYADDDPITVEYVPDDAESTKVHVKPWLLEKGDPA